VWLAPDGQEMNDDAWNADFVRAIGMLLAGNAIEETGDRGEPITGDTLLVLLNAHSEKVAFTLPPLAATKQWQRVFDTTHAAAGERGYKPGSRYPLQGRSVVAFKVTPPLRERRKVAAARSAREPAREAEPVGAEA